MKITMAHGSGGESTSKLIRDVFSKHFDNEYLSKLEDSAVVPSSEMIAMTTDSFVVTPLEFPGGDIGRLSVCGTVNDLLMSGSVPKYITCGCILEEGLDISLLNRVIASMAKTAKEAGVLIVTGDTKVIENRGGEGGLIINTSGVGLIPDVHIIPSPSLLSDGDVIIVSGNLGDHHAAILGKRMGIQSDILSDNAPLVDIVTNLMNSGINIHAMRDVTRGGLATVLNEFAESSAVSIELFEEYLPVSSAVSNFCQILGLDPLYMGNEGKMVLSIPESDSEKALGIIKRSKYGENAQIVGTVKKDDAAPCVFLRTRIGGKRIVGPLYGEGLPRIC
ncbi:MAG: hydrogenase expression/formation protein HypE [Butyrivibrio sp.]|nr:hydrogenase expression/formation protein HypE [Butyrivibrio sp.]